jgi:hypothetical protein
MSQPPVEIVEYLIAALDDPNQDIRIEAHDDLARLQGAQAVEALLRLPKMLDRLAETHSAPDRYVATRGEG